MTDTSVPVLACRVTHSPTDHVRLEIPAVPATAVVLRLGENIRTVRGAGPVLDLGTLPPGGYGVEITADGRRGRTAVEVTADPRSRMRYGFAVDFSAGRDPAEVAVLVRRLHLTAVQFYDWAFRHAHLLGPDADAEYGDPLGRVVSPATVRALVGAVQDAGAAALGYAAVYGVGRDEWPTWQHDALLRPTGKPYGLGDFLDLLDPAAPDWLAHFRAELTAARDAFGFDGFHLDQYGYPKRAVRADGVVVDLADSFAAVIHAVREELPTATLVFNQVNDFPTWRTGTTPQDATYIELWPPHTTLADLSRTVTRARAVAPHRPVVVAAYQNVYEYAPAEIADLAASFTMATLFSHGATQLLVGEGGRLLTDPYYVRNHPAGSDTLDLLARWYDFLVEHGELLLDPRGADVSGSYLGEYNGDLDVAFPAAVTAGSPSAGTVWCRVVDVPGHLLVHLINLKGQTDTEWDAPRRPPADPGPGVLRFRRAGPHLPRVRVADPDRLAHLVDVDVAVDGDDAVVALPTQFIWQLVVIDTVPGREPSARS